MFKRSIVLFVSLLSCIFVFSSCNSANIYATTYSASLSTSGSVNINVSSAGNSANTATDNVKVISTCPLGYNLSIAATSPTNTSFNDTTLYKDGDSTSSSKISPTAGTKDNPVTITGDNLGTWGFSMTSSNATGTFTALTTTQTLITTKSTASGDGTTNLTSGADTIPIYYGASVTNDTMPGLYKMTDNAVITYYLTTSLDCTSYQVAFNPTSTMIDSTTGSIITVTGTGAMDNQRIAEGTTVALDTNQFTAPTISGTQYYFTGWNTKQDGTGTSYTDGQSVTDLTTVGNTITLYAQWTDCPVNSICYDKNQGTDTTNTVEGTMGNQSVSANAETVLLASNYSRTGYGFAGWSDVSDYSTNSNAKFYGPQESIATPATISSKGLKLYAVWIKSVGSLQDSTLVTSLCGTNGAGGSLTAAPTDGTANLSSVSALTDQRDNQTYAIARLADGNCWMVENLRLENAAEHNSDGTLAQGYATGFIGLANPESTNFFSYATANSLYSTTNITGSDQGYRFPRYDHLNTQNRAINPTNNAFPDYDTVGGMYSYGNYYTWAAAIADTTYYSSGTHNTTSICPSGWSIPIGAQSTADKSFGALSVALGGPAGGATANTSSTPTGAVMSKAFRSYPNNFLYSGFQMEHYASNKGTVGRYWSSTVENGNSKHSYALSLSNTLVSTQSSTVRYLGYSIRCLAGS